MKTITRQVEIILPILLPLPNDYDLFNGIIEDVVEEIVFTPIIFPLCTEYLFNQEVLVNFQRLNKDDERLKLCRTGLRNHIYLIANADLEIIDRPIDEIKDWGIPSIEFLSIDIVDYFIKRMYDFIIGINIAKVGSIEIDRGLVFIDKKIYKKTGMMISLLKEVYKFTKETNWPVLEDLEIKKVWNWLIDKTGFLDGVGGTPVERALTALTYLFNSSGESNEGMDLFFSMIGLEALYCSSKYKIKNQLIKKIQIFLGTPNKYEKLLKNMYKYRSKFIHGGLNFPGKYHIFDAIEEFERYQNDYYHTILMAQSVLLATIQQLIKRNMNNSRFWSKTTSFRKNMNNKQRLYGLHSDKR